MLVLLITCTYLVFINVHILNFSDTAVTILLTYFLTVFYQQLNVYFLPLVVLDLLVYIYLIGRIMKMFVFIFSLAIWASLFYMKHIQILTEFLKKTLILAQKGALSQKAFSQRLFSFLNEHTKISMLYNFTDHEVWSRVSFHCMACQIPTNIYIVYRAMDPKLNGSKLIVTYLFMVNQIVMIFIALMFLAKAAKVIPQGHRYIPKLQCFIPKTMLLFKLKYMQLYERLNNKKKIGTAVGPIGTITYKMNFRVCLIKLNTLSFLQN